jgi:hypothetical protein
MYNDEDREKLYASFLDDPESLGSVEYLINTVDVSSSHWRNVCPPVMDFATKMMIVMRDLKKVLADTLQKTSTLSKTFQLKLTNIERHMKDYDDSLAFNIKEIKR